MNTRILLAGVGAVLVVVGTKKGGFLKTGGIPRGIPAGYPPDYEPPPDPVYVPESPPFVPPPVYVPEPAPIAAPLVTLAEVTGRVVAAAATLNATAMRVEAAKLRREGWPDHASDLETLANRTEALQAAGVPAPVKPPPAPPPVVVAPKPPPAPAPVVVAPAPPPKPAATPLPLPVPVTQAPPVPPKPTMPISELVGLKSGDKGERVKVWQVMLRSDGFENIAGDGNFGPLTVEATGFMQVDRSQAKTGIVDNQLLTTLTLPAILGGRTLKKDSRGGAVKSWQRVLIADGQTDVKVDGHFGPETVNGTIFYQKKRGLEADGIAGPATFKAMGLPLAAASVVPVTTAAVAAVVSTIYATTFDPAKWRATLKQGDKGNDVAEWQTVLSRDGYVVTPDGLFGPDTKTKTIAWQKARGLTADGIVGPASRAKIVLTPGAAPPATAARVSGFQLPEQQQPWRDFVAVSPLPDGGGGLPSVKARVPTEEVAPERALASKVALHLMQTPAGREDRSLLSLFQSVNGLNATGHYGPGTAEVLIGYGLVPPMPRAWPSKGSMITRARYKATLLAQARRDPQRQIEWQAAARALDR